MATNDSNKSTDTANTTKAGDTSQPADKRVVRDGVKNPDGQQSPPSGAHTTPEVYDGFQLDKKEYEYDPGRHTLEVHRDRPNHIYENQETQQAAENTVAVANGEVDKNGKRPEDTK